MNLHNVEFVRSAAGAQDLIRDGLPQIAFAGKSNVGKSSVINRLLQRKNFARVGEAPGKTTHVNYFRVDGKAYFVDLPGYGYAKVSQGEKERWGKLMEAYFARLPCVWGPPGGRPAQPHGHRLHHGRLVSKCRLPLCWWWPISWIS